MKVLVCLISSQQNIVETVEQQRERLIPQEFLKKNNGSVHFMAFNPQMQNISFEKFLLRQSNCKEAVILLVENRHSHLTESIANAVFAATFEIQDQRINNFKNFFGSYFGRLFRHFFAIKNLMSDAEKEQAMILPFRNFASAELAEMARLVRDESLSSTFIFDLEARLAKIVKRRLPRKRSNHKTKYFIDDKGTHFVYGSEKHARYDTGEPHRTECNINGLFRFGKSIDSSRHFNVSFGGGDDTSISGDFPDCHDGIKTITKTLNRTHINMFANDFC